MNSFAQAQNRGGVAFSLAIASQETGVKDI